MSTVTCINCNAKNTEGSKFCNNCGAALPLSSHITCPTCGVRNPRNLMYCDNCGTRLLPTGELSSEREEEKPPPPESREAPRAFSLPAREPGDELDPNRLFDWLRTGEESPEGEETAGQETADIEQSVVDDWLADLSDLEVEETEDIPQESNDHDDDEALPDWLSGGEDWQEAGADSEDEALPDWLAGFEADEDETPTLIGSTSTETEEEDLPDWLNDFEATDETPTLIDSTPTETDEEDLPDWLNDFEATEETPTLISSTPAETDEEDLPDWLNDFEAVDETPTLIDSTRPAIDEEDELPDWFSDLETAEVASSDEKDEGADWLSELGLDEAAQAPAEPAEPADTAQVEESLTDWLDMFDEEDEGQPLSLEPALDDSAEEAIIPDWLSDFDDDDDSTAAFDLDLDLSGEEEDSETLPDWLDDLKAPDLADDDEEEATVVGAAAVEATVDEPEPDEANITLEDFAFDSLDFDDEEADAETADEALLPDWLSEMPSEGQTLRSVTNDEEDERDDIFTEFDSADFSHVDELPDWLSELDPTIAEAEEEAAPEEVTDSDVSSLIEEDEIDELFEDDDNEGLPDWLAEFSAASDGLTFDDDDDEDWTTAVNPEESWPDVVDEEELAARLALAERDVQEPRSPSKELKGVPEALVSPGLPDWLEDDLPEFAKIDQVEEPFFGDEASEIVQGELPDWLKEMKPADSEPAEQDFGLGEGFALAETQDEWQTILENMPPSQDEGELAGPGTAGLSSADIPAWLQALKPSVMRESIEIIESDEPPVMEGPLIGLRGVLPVAPTIKPAAATTAVQYTISKEQQQQISLLHQLTHEEPAKTKQIIHKKETSFSPLWRAIFGLLLFAAVLAGVILPKMDIGLPETALPVSQSTLDTFDVVDPLVGRSVLVAFDYTPAMAAELDPIARMLLGQLATNDNRILTISQSAAGTAIAQQLVSEVEGLDSQSLGLLTGEAVGLRSLGSCLNSADNCEPLFGFSANDALQDSTTQSNLTDLGLIIVLTSDRNSLINWVEQVESQTDTPVITAVAQPLGPLTIPYLSSKQLNGSLNGIPAASAYERRLLGQDGGAFQQYAAQTIVMWLVIVALIVAGLFYGLTGLTKRGPKKGSG